LRTQTALVATALLLLVIVCATVITAIAFPSPSAKPTLTPPVVSARTTSSATVTKLQITIAFPNGTRFVSGSLSAGGMKSVIFNETYLFDSITPGNYSVTYSGNQSVYLPPTTVSVSSGINVAKLTVYKIVTFVLVNSPNLTFNNTSPGPSIMVDNGTAVRITLRNNSSLIHDFAVVKILGNVSTSNVLFGSTSDTLNAGGTTNDTFVVTSPGSFYYQDLIGSHAKDGEYGYFLVQVPNSVTTRKS
jgi:hypothetical protein